MCVIGLLMLVCCQDGDFDSGLCGLGMNLVDLGLGYGDFAELVMILMSYTRGRESMCVIGDGVKMASFLVLDHVGWG